MKILVTLSLIVISSLFLNSISNATINNCKLEVLGECQICETTYILDKGICVQSCEAGEFKKTNSYSYFGQTFKQTICDACFDQNCQSCTDGEENSCTACVDGYDLISKKCILKTEEEVTCEDTQFKLIANGKLTCVDECPENSFAEMITKVCETCPLTCETCDSTGKCTKCASNSYSFNDMCVKSCPESTALDAETKTCMACDSSCLACAVPGDSTQCAACKTGVLTKAVDYDKLMTLIKSEEQMNKIVEILLVFLNHPQARTAINSLAFFIPELDMLLDLTNNKELIVDFTKKLDTLDVTKTISESEEYLEIIKQNFDIVSFMSTNQDFIEELQKLYAQCQVRSCSTACSSGEYENDDGECQVCSKMCKTCSSGSDSSCLSCNSGFVLKGSSCVSQESIKKELVSQGTETFVSQITQINDATGLEEKIEEILQIFSTGSDSASNAFTAEELGLTENNQMTEEEKEAFALFQSEAKTNILTQFQNIINDDSSQTSTNQQTLIKTGKQILELAGSANSEDILTISQLFNSNSFTSEEEILENAVLEESFELLTELMNSKDNLYSSNEIGDLTDEQIQEKIKLEDSFNAGIETLIDNYFKNNENSPITQIGNSLAISLQKTNPTDFEQFIQQKMDSNTDQLGKFEIPEEGINQFKELLSSLDQSETNQNILVTQQIKTIDDYNTESLADDEVYSKVMQLKFDYFDKNNAKQEVPVKDLQEAISLYIPTIKELVLTADEKELYEFVCKYYDESSKTWTVEGVNFVTDGTNNYCQSTHLTDFVIAKQKIQNEKTTESDDESSGSKVLMLVLIIGGSVLVATIALAASIYIYLSRKKKKASKCAKISQQDVVIQKL